MVVGSGGGDMIVVVDESSHGEKETTWCGRSRVSEARLCKDPRRLGVDNIYVEFFWGCLPLSLPPVLRPILSNLNILFCTPMHKELTSAV